METLVKKVREDFEQKQIPKEKLAELYAKYNPSVDTQRFVIEAEKLFPTLNCGLASVYLREVLGCGEVVRGTYKNHNHTFLLLSDGTIIDITADQYGGPSVYIGVLMLPWSL